MTTSQAGNSDILALIDDAPVRQLGKSIRSLIAFEANKLGLEFEKMHSTLLYYCITIAVNMMVGNADVFTVYLFELDTSCLLKHVYSDGSSTQGFLETVYNITIDECIYQCFYESSGMVCNVIQYNKDNKKCTLYNGVERKLLKKFDYQESTVSMLFVFSCESGYQSSLSNMFSRNHFTLHSLYSAKSEIWGQTCLLEQRDLELSHHAHFLGISYGTIESCVFTCNAFLSATSCNAVSVSQYNNSCSYYNFKVKQPPIQNATANRPQITIIHLCFTDNLRISSYDVQYGRSLHYLLTAAPQPFPSHHESRQFYTNNSITTIIFWFFESKIHLFRHFELCIVRSFPISSLNNLFILRKFNDIRSFNMCLNLCRQTITSWPYRAVIYSRKNKKCAVLGSGIGYKTVKLNENVIITEVRDCNLDRMEERTDNPPPLKYYFEETNDICFVELNTLNYSNYFTVVQKTQNVESFKQCLRLCRQTVSKLNCMAVDYTTEMQCSLLKRIVNNGTFYKHGNSVFAELLFCEKATVADLVLNFYKILLRFNLLGALPLGKNQYHLNLKMHLAHLYCSIIIAANVMVGTADVFTVFLPALEISCLLRKVNANALSMRGFLGDLYNSTIDECIYFCFFEKYDDGCNVIKFMKPIKTCAIYDGTKMELYKKPSLDVQTLPVLFIQDCDEGYKNSLSEEFARNYTTTNSLFYVKSKEFDEMCLLEMRYVKSIHNSLFLGNSFGSFEICVFTCNAFSAKTLCNAVIHHNEMCSHYYFEVKEPPPLPIEGKTSPLIIIHLCLEGDLHVSSYDVKYGYKLYYLLSPIPYPAKQNNSANGTKAFAKFNDAAIHLFKHFELCVVRVFPINNLGGLFVLKSYNSIPSFISCLHLCRQTVSSWPYRAVMYKKKDQQCVILGSGVGYRIHTFEKNVMLAELRNCMLDRVEERIDNPPPLKYYFEETSDICFVEVNVLNDSSYFNVAQKTQNVESFKQCLKLCRKAIPRCAAVDYTTRKQCSLLKKVAHNGTFYKYENSVFAEILYCERATMIDLINDF
ncbi:hypothetical protein T4D_5647 [Trichinella pseudospiralis]|uniref:Apple domain-containing protein n=2 Tax=Trichinella pseudospiralis TaxID=6337 RepID=A0A0V1G4T5_TRIPS|nr:hypothetical protein T4D_5647 [Trichinella pseudospiralis]